MTTNLSQESLKKAFKEELKSVLINTELDASLNPALEYSKKYGAFRVSFDMTEEDQFQKYLLLLEVLKSQNIEHVLNTANGKQRIAFKGIVPNFKSHYSNALRKFESINNLDDFIEVGGSNSLATALNLRNIDGKIKFLRKEMEDLILEAVSNKLTHQVGKLNEMRSQWNVLLKKEAKTPQDHKKQFTEMKLEFIEFRKEVLQAKFDSVAKLIQNKIDHSIGKGLKRFLYNILPAPVGDFLMTPNYLINAKSELNNLKNNPRLSGQMSNSSSLNILKDLSLIEYDATNASSSTKPKIVERIVPKSMPVHKKEKPAIIKEKTLKTNHQKLIFSKALDTDPHKLPGTKKRKIEMSNSGTRKKKKMS